MMGAKAHHNAADSTKSEVGEIDTRAPFESVKAAVSLFGVAALSSDKRLAKKSKPLVTKSIVAKERQLELAQIELDKLKEQLSNAEATRAHALTELEEAKRAAADLAAKLKLIIQSKESAVHAAGSAKTQLNKYKEDSSQANAEDGSNWALELDKSRENFSIIIAELDRVKQELSRTRRDLEASKGNKASAMHRQAEAEKLTLSNKQRASQLVMETKAVNESLIHVKHALLQTQQEETRIQSEKELSRQEHKLALEAAEKTLASLREELNPEALEGLKSMLAEVEAEVNVVKKELTDHKQADLESSASMKAEIDAARETLHQVAEEEVSLRGTAELLRSELEKIKKENAELTEKEAQTETLVADLDRKLREAKAELHVAGSRQTKAEAARDELISARQQLLLEAEDAKKEAEEMKRTAAELKKETAAASIILEEAEKKLHAALRDAEEAKAAEEIARNESKLLSEKTSAAVRASTSDSGETITISGEEYRSLNQAGESSEALVEMKVAAVAAQVEAMRSSENEAARRLEMVQQELKEVSSATEAALKRAEMAEAARRAVEAELKRWREREQKGAVAVAAPPQLRHHVKDSGAPYRLSGEQQRPV